MRSIFLKLGSNTGVIEIDSVMLVFSKSNQNKKEEELMKSRNYDMTTENYDGSGD